MNDRHIIGFHVNGDFRQVGVGRKTTLLHVLRDELHLTGTKNGCGQGRCGACTVIVDGKAVRSCVYLAHRSLVPRLAVGHPLPRPDARAKATGEAVFAADLYPSTGSGHRFEGMLHGKVLRSRYPHAKVRG